LADTVDLEAPWLTPNAEKWDDMTLDDYLRGYTSDKTMFTLFELLVNDSLGVPITKISFLMFLY